MSADDFRIVLDQGTPVVWAADREAWRRGITREAIARANALVWLLRQQQQGGYEPADVAGVMLLEQVERMLTSASKLLHPEPFSVACEEECADDVLGPDRSEGVRVGNVVLPRGLEGDPAMSSPPGRVPADTGVSDAPPGKKPGSSAAKPSP